ncbi:MAG: hypothetical protein K6E38_04865 [Fretibacterium sp.]|nr:hypothetical protein [Fretibacterium sp.]
MRKSTGHPFFAFLLIAVLGTVLVMGADAAMSVRPSRRQGNVLPVGWMYDMRYSVWCAQRGLSATPRTWRKYTRERDRLTRRAGGIRSPLLDTLDSAMEDFSELWEARQGSRFSISVP